MAMGPAHLGMLDLDADGRVRFVPDKSVALTLDGAAADGRRHSLQDRRRTPAGPSKIGFDEGKGLATVIKRGDRVALRVKHCRCADAHRHFARPAVLAGRSRLEGRPARFVPHPAGKTLPIVNIVNTVEQVPNPGAVEFEHDGKTHRLEALDEGEPTLFLVFADRTSGHGSYPAGPLSSISRARPRTSR